MCDTGFKQTQNHHKFLATGAEFVDHNLQANFAICTGITRLKDGRNITEASTMETNSQRAFGMSVVKSSHSTISDRAAKEVALLFYHNDDVCLMHDTDKLARAATGGLVRRKNGKAVNPFPAGQFLVKKVHACAVHFSYSTRFDKMMHMAEGTLQAGSYPKTRPQVDKNTTRVMTVHNLFYSTCRLVKPMQIYGTAKSTEKTTKEVTRFVSLTSSEW